MDKFRDRADECRRLSSQAASPELREHFLKLAETWDQLALARACLASECHVTPPAPDDREG